MHPEFVQFVAAERTRAFEQEAEHARQAPGARLFRAEAEEPAFVIRLCRVSDRSALERLAALEQRPLPHGSFVVGEIGGVVAAALPLDEDVPALADPFCPTAHLVSLLQLRAAQLRRAERRRLPRLRRRTAAA